MSKNTLRSNITGDRFLSGGKIPEWDGKSHLQQLGLLPGMYLSQSSILTDDRYKELARSEVGFFTLAAGFSEVPKIEKLQNGDYTVFGKEFPSVRTAKDYRLRKLKFLAEEEGRNREKSRISHQLKVAETRELDSQLQTMSTTRTPRNNSDVSSSVLNPIHSVSDTEYSLLMKHLSEVFTPKKSQSNPKTYSDMYTGKAILFPTAESLSGTRMSLEHTRSPVEYASFPPVEPMNALYSSTQEAPRSSHPKSHSFSSPSSSVPSYSTKETKATKTIHALERSTAFVPRPLQQGALITNYLRSPPSQPLESTSSVQWESTNHTPFGLTAVAPTLPYSHADLHTYADRVHTTPSSTSTTSTSTSTCQQHAQKGVTSERLGRTGRRVGREKVELEGEDVFPLRHRWTDGPKSHSVPYLQSLRKIYGVQPDQFVQKRSGAFSAATQNASRHPAHPPDAENKVNTSRKGSDTVQRLSRAAHSLRGTRKLQNDACTSYFRPEYVPSSKATLPRPMAATFPDGSFTSKATPVPAPGIRPVVRPLPPSKSPLDDGLIWVGEGGHIHSIPPVTPSLPLSVSVEEQFYEDELHTALYSSNYAENTQSLFSPHLTHSSQHVHSTHPHTSSLSGQITHIPSSPWTPLCSSMSPVFGVTRSTARVPSPHVGNAPTPQRTSQRFVTTPRRESYDTPMVDQIQQVIELHRLWTSPKRDKVDTTPPLSSPTGTYRTPSRSTPLFHGESVSLQHEQEVPSTILPMMRGKMDTPSSNRTVANLPSSPAQPTELPLPKGRRHSVVSAVSAVSVEIPPFVLPDTSSEESLEPLYCDTRPNPHTPKERSPYKSPHRHTNSTTDASTIVNRSALLSKRKKAFSEEGIEFKFEELNRVLGDEFEANNGLDILPLEVMPVSPISEHIPDDNWKAVGPSPISSPLEITPVTGSIMSNDTLPSEGVPITPPLLVPTPVALQPSPPSNDKYIVMKRSEGYSHKARVLHRRVDTNITASAYTPSPVFETSARQGGTPIYTSPSTPSTSASSILTPPCSISSRSSASDTPSSTSTESNTLSSLLCIDSEVDSLVPPLFSLDSKNNSVSTLPNVSEGFSTGSGSPATFFSLDSPFSPPPVHPQEVMNFKSDHGYDLSSIASFTGLDKTTEKTETDENNGNAVEAVEKVPTMQVRRDRRKEMRKIYRRHQYRRRHSFNQAFYDSTTTHSTLIPQSLFGRRFSFDIDAYHQVNDTTGLEKYTPINTTLPFSGKNMSPSLCKLGKSFDAITTSLLDLSSSKHPDSISITDLQNDVTQSEIDGYSSKSINSYSSNRKSPPSNTYTSSQSLDTTKSPTSPSMKVIRQKAINNELRVQSMNLQGALLRETAEKLDDELHVLIQKAKFATDYATNG